MTIKIAYPELVTTAVTYPELMSVGRVLTEMDLWAYTWGWGGSHVGMVMMSAPPTYAWPGCGMVSSKWRTWVVVTPRVLLDHVTELRRKFTVGEPLELWERPVTVSRGRG